jgi:hypothetical protein
MYGFYECVCVLSAIFFLLMSTTVIDESPAAVLKELQGAQIVRNILNEKVLSSTFSSYSSHESDSIIQQWTQATARLSILEQRYKKLTSTDTSNNSSINSTPRSISNSTPLMRYTTPSSITTPSIPKLPHLHTNLFSLTPSSSSPSALATPTSSSEISSPNFQANNEDDKK